MRRMARTPRAARGPVNTQPRDGAIPVPQKRILRVEVEAAAFERVVFDVATAALLLAVFLRAARPCGQPLDFEPLVATVHNLIRSH
jgi:hypothetical protein